MIISISSFAVLGFIFGFLADINALFVKSFSKKIIIFFIDVLLFVIYGLLFFCLLLVVNDGVIRGAFFVGCIVGFALYMLTIFRLFTPLRRRLVVLVKKSNSYISTKLKSFKKLLHLPK